jgi:HlyD family secretion protein
MNRWVKRSFGIAAGLGVAAAIAYSYVPKPVRVETEAVARGPLLVEVTADGQTRVKRRYVVSAPLGGVISRPELRAGDAVHAGDPLVTLAPIDPPLLDARSRAQAEAQVKVAIAARAQAEAQVDLARTTLSFAESELAREKQLAASGSSTPAALEAAELKVKSGAQQLAAARIGVSSARSSEEAARAALSRAEGRGDAGVSLRAPTDGRVLRVLVNDGGVVAAGMPIFEVGDPGDLEIVLDMLSTDAVNVRRGARATIERWGGPDLLLATVRTVEPYGFTKVSALGIEEQRVNVIADFDDHAAMRAPLGDGYRVEARVVVADLPDVLRVPLSALFRSGDAWAVFAITGDKANVVPISLGHRNDRWAEVLSGLSEGARVVLHPGDRLRDGIAVEPKPIEPKSSKNTPPPVAVR